MAGEFLQRAFHEGSRCQLIGINIIPENPASSGFHQLAPRKFRGSLMKPVIAVEATVMGEAR